MKHLLKMSDLSPAELHHILDVAEELKQSRRPGRPRRCSSRSVALMFSKIPPAPAPALRWVSTSWAVWAIT